jgi:hypothetical protein
LAGKDESKVVLHLYHIAALAPRRESLRQSKSQGAKALLSAIWTLAPQLDFLDTAA